MCLEGTDGKEQLVVEFDQQRRRAHNYSPSGAPGVETLRNFFQEFSRDCLGFLDEAEIGVKSREVTLECLFA
jgi:hypothetical protein